MKSVFFGLIILLLTGCHRGYTLQYEAECIYVGQYKDDHYFIEIATGLNFIVTDGYEMSVEPEDIKTSGDYQVVLLTFPNNRKGNFGQGTLAVGVSSTFGRESLHYMESELLDIVYGEVTIYITAVYILHCVIDNIGN